MSRHGAGSVPRERTIRWVFLDRDGTLNVSPRQGEYIERPEELVLLPGAAEGVRMLNRAGLWTAVVTNQRGVALGRMSAEDLDRVHERLRKLLREQEAHVDAVYACPHGIDECGCRKPRPGLLLRAQSEHPELDFMRAAIVGDSPSDVRTGQQLGLTTVLLADAERAPSAVEPAADHVVADLASAARLLLARA
jgi:D-glycero-D-manno-heptose 1,7-bisphosphate phosphatase